MFSEREANKCVNKDSNVGKSCYGLTGVVYNTFFRVKICKKIYSIFTTYCIFINVLIGKRRKWWLFYNKPNSYLFNEFPFNIGPFLVGSMWILKWTYGNLKQFLLLNASVNAFFAFILVRIMEKLKVAKLIRLSHFQLFMYFFYKAPLLYGIQYIIDLKKKFS